MSLVVATLLGLLAAAPAAEARALPETCTYRTYAWSVKAKRAVDRRTVRKPYRDVRGDERSPEDPRCTVCREDQVAVTVEGLPTVSVCHAYAAAVRAALVELAADPTFDIVALDGYRAGRTRGAVVDGKRTAMSNHAYGTAVDINPKSNGLYGRCDVPAELATDDLARRVERCKLRVGGPWDPRAQPRRTIVRGGPAWRAFTRFWKWGGAIAGPTRDFMHFSVTGH